MLYYFASGYPTQMIVLEFKAKGKPTQYSAIDEAI
jgi:hypothetical protein